MSERDSSKVVINEPVNGRDYVVLTGDRPTGPLHLGHYVGSLAARVRFQKQYTQYVLIADMQALTDNADNPGKVRENVFEVMLDYLAVGISPEESTIYLQSAIPETAELTLYLLNLISVGRLSRNPTVKNEIKARGFGDEVPAGFWAYPVNQAADISQFRATLIPVGPDQIPMIELTNDLVRNFNRIYHTDALVECKALVPLAGLLPGTDGNSKMSKSLGNAIYLKDSSDIVAKKVKGMFTDPAHLKIEDPGKIDGNPVFAYLDAFDEDKKYLENMKGHYIAGGLADGIVKKRLIEVLEAFLTPIRVRREQFAREKSEVMGLLKKGTERSRTRVIDTLLRVRNAIGIVQL